MPAVRGCGAARTRGGIYAVCGTSPTGRDIEDFVICQPQPLDVKRLGIPSIGVHLVDFGGALGKRPVDRVGLSHYLNVADYVEETGALGMSRKFPPNFPFHELQKGAYLLLAHDRAWIGAPYLYQSERIRVGRDDYMSAYGGVTKAGADPVKWCPRGVADHAPEEYMGHCAGLFWEDIEGGEPVLTAGEIAKAEGNDHLPVAGFGAGYGDARPGIRQRAVHRKIGSTEYTAYARPEMLEGASPLYRPAIFMAIPILALEVIASPDGAHEQGMARASRSGIAVAVCDE